MDLITATVAITVGVTFYSEPGAGMACGGVFTDGQPVWAAAPIEWNKDGYVSCGDLAVITLADGRTVTAPIRDFGCHLHWPVGRSIGGDGALPYGAELARIDETKGWRTGIGNVAVYRVKEDRWWTPPPMTAWGTKWCDGPLTIDPWQEFVQECRDRRLPIEPY